MQLGNHRCNKVRVEIVMLRSKPLKLTVQRWSYLSSVCVEGCITTHANSLHLLAVQTFITKKFQEIYLFLMQREPEASQGQEWLNGKSWHENFDTFDSISRLIVRGYAESFLMPTLYINITSLVSVCFVMNMHYQEHLSRSKSPNLCNDFPAKTEM
jgi:hypothetical protein